MTSKDMTSSVFSFGRDHGHYGRILNQAVAVENSYVKTIMRSLAFVLHHLMVIPSLAAYPQQNGFLSSFF